MINVIKLVWINLLNLFDINKILVARDSGVKSNSEKRTILTGVVIVVFAYLIYLFMKFFGINDKTNILNIGFIAGTIISILVSSLIVSSTIFKSDDIELLFSLPLSKNQIVYSKLFSVYLKNIIFVSILMLVCSYSYNNSTGINQSVGLMIAISTLLIPIIPIVIVSIFSYISNYMKVKYSKFKRIIMILIMYIIVIGGLYLIKDYKIFKYLYPTYNCFKYMISYDNNYIFILFMVINLVIMFIYSHLISSNYSKICSMLKGVRKNNGFEIGRCKNKGNVIGYLRKDINYLFQNKNYLNNVITLRLLVCLGLIMVFIFVPYSKISNYEDLDIVMEWFYVPVLSIISILGVYNISSVSMEKNNINIVKTLPISISKVLFSKWLCGLVIGLIFIIINSSFSNIYFRPNMFIIVMSYVMPLFYIMFIELLSLVLDYRFNLCSELDDNVILRQRVISYIPMLISLGLLGLLFLIYGLGDYKYVLMGISAMCLLGIIACIGYLIIQRKKLYKGL